MIYRAVGTREWGQVSPPPLSLIKALQVAINVDMWHIHINPSGKTVDIPVPKGYNSMVVYLQRLFYYMNIFRYEFR
jgi:hypothetical protein